jgi:peptidoglycan hydrolase CwlO-like protein
MSLWCLMFIITAFGLGAFVAGWQLIQAQERLNEKNEEEIKRCMQYKEEAEAQLNEYTKKIKKLEEENKALKERIDKLESILEERETEIATLKKILSEKTAPGHKTRHRRSRILD